MSSSIPTCEVYNLVTHGMCNTTLDDRGECPRQDEHGTSDQDREV